MNKKVIASWMALTACCLVPAGALGGEGNPSRHGSSDKAEYEFADAENLTVQKGIPDPFLMPGGRLRERS